MGVVIRHLGPSDDHLMANVAEDVFDHGITDARLAAYLAARNHLMCVALCNGLVVGQVRACIIKHPDKATDLLIDNVGVAPAYQRQGTARRLLEEIIQLGKERGCQEIWVGTEADNEAAHALYGSLGLAAQKMVVFDGAL